jgi:predicted PurR-regulated permease PerM
MAELAPSPLPEAGGKTLRVAGALIIVSFVLAVLYLGRMVLEPLAMAVLLAFVLNPPIRRLRGLHVGRVTSVIAVVIVALGIIGAIGFVIETEITELADEIPQYQKNLSAKIASLNRALISSGTLKQASSTLNSLASELKGQPRSGSLQDAASGGVNERTPIPVEVHTPQPAVLEYLQELLGPLLTPLTMGGLLILFLVFILFYREDLRDRVLRLAGTRDLQRTTEAMNDAGRRLSRFFLIQAAINASFGALIAAGLWALGVPNAVLWGVMAAILRFVPFIGTPMAAVFPLVLAAAIDPGWTRVILTAALFFVSELATGQAIEPVLQGQQTGLSPLAIVVAQLFWTLIWGVPGLLLAVPVTVCIAVLGRHTEALSFLGVILGDQPALAPHEGFYQRMLADDATEATFQAEEQLATERLSDYYDAVPMKALALANGDAAAGRLNHGQQLQLRDVIEDVAADLSDYSDEEGEPGRQKPAPEAGKADVAGAAAPINASSEAEEAPPSVFLIAARSPIDQSANLLLAQILEKRGVRAAVQPYSREKRKQVSPSAMRSRIICISCFSTSPMGPALVRYSIRRWQRVAPHARFVACFWFAASDGATLDEMRKTAGADLIATSLGEAASLCLDDLIAVSKVSAHARTGPSLVLHESRTHG